MLTIARQVRPDGITVGMCEVAVNTAAYVCSEMHLPGLDVETALRSTNNI